MLTLRHARPRPHPLRAWWREHRALAGMLLIWLVLLDGMAESPLLAPGPARLYRLELADGMLFFMRAARRAECDANPCQWTDPAAREGTLEPPP